MGKEPKPKPRRDVACLQCDYRTGNAAHMTKHVHAVHAKLEVAIFLVFFFIFFCIGQVGSSNFLYSFSF